MADFLYDAYVENMWGEGTRIDFDTDTINAILSSSSDYATPSQSADDFFNDTGYATINQGYNSEPSQTFSNKTIGVIAARTIDNTASLTYTAVAQDAAKLVDQVVVYKFVTSTTDSPLMIFYDFTGITPNGGDIQVTPNASGLAVISQA